jgi:preprotein translocase subunit YajC
LIDIAYAMGTGASPGGQGGGGFSALLPLLLMFAIFYFLLIRPQQKKAKQHREMINNLAKGDRVITSGGIHGSITSLDDTTVTVEISDKVKIKVLRGNISVVNGASGQTAAKSKS